MEENTIRTDRIKSISQRVWEKVGNLTWIEIISIAIFGSVARQEDDSDSDIDLLIVAEYIPEKRIERIPDMVKVKRELNLEFPLDVLLVSKHECRSNFRNHNPLYLDIALDAKIVCDDSGFLRNLIEETREYIDSRGLRREGDSWSFPVIERFPTELSRITIKGWAIGWLSDAKRDLVAASRLLESALFEKAVYHCQQAVEKGTKAVLVSWGRFKRTHFVADTLRIEIGKRDLGEWLEKLTKIADIGDILEPHVFLSRYPEVTDGILRLPSEKYDTDAAEQYLESAEHVVKTVEEFIQWWFSSS